MGNKSDKPKRKPNSYNLFIKKCMGEYSDEMKGQPFGAAAPFMKKCSIQWGALNDNEKAEYKNKSNKCTYLEEENKWKC